MTHAHPDDFWTGIMWRSVGEEKRTETKTVRERWIIGERNRV